jgi:DMSO/TMAO reductase YedYZ molybdopterin-dependent catalytic subunit
MLKRFSRKVYWLMILILLTSLPAACGQGGGAPEVAWTLNVSGAVGNPLELSYDDLLEWEQVALEDVLMRRSQGEDTLTAWEGPAVTSILEKAGISSGATGVTAIAADGYAIEMTLADLENAIVALRGDGEWIAEDGEHGPIRLIVPDKPANHWLYQLTDLIVEESAIASPTPRPTKSPTPPPPADVVLEVTGQVAAPLAPSLADLQAMGPVTIEAAHPKSGDMGSYEGVPLNTLLEEAGLQGGEMLVATASDGFSVEIPLADVKDCADCLVAFGEDESLRLIMPGMSSKTWVKDLVSLTVT